MRNTLYFGDNLNVMREMPTHSYHLCYFDPPFNSGRNYNIFLANSTAQRKAFDDIWRWDDAARENQAAVLYYDGKHPELVETMDNLAACLSGFDTILKGGGRTVAEKPNRCVRISPSWHRGWLRFGGC